MSLVANTLGVARSTVYARLAGRTKPRGRYTKAEDTQLLPRIEDAMLLAPAPTPENCGFQMPGSRKKVCQGCIKGGASGEPRKLALSN